MSTVNEAPQASERASIVELQRQGEDHAARGELAAALRLFGRALTLARALGDEVMVSDLLGALGEVHCEQGGFDEAIDAFKEALQLDQKHQDHAGAVAMHRRLGLAFQEKGDAERANDAYRDAEQLLRRLDPEEESRQRILLLTAQASFDAERGGFRSAQEKLEEALTASEEAGDVAQQIACLRRLAGVIHERGDLVGAHERLDRAQLLLDQQSDAERDVPELIQVLLLRGAVLEDEGSTQLALDRYREALRRAEALRLAPARADCLRRMGSAHRARGDFPQAVDRFEQAIAICKELADQAALSQLHGDLGEVFAEQGSLDDAIRHFRNGLDLDQRHQDRLGMAVAQRRLGSVYQEKGEFGRAEDAYNEVARLLEDSDDESEKALLCTSWGSLHAARGHYTTALESHEKALEIYESQGNELGQATCLRHMGAARQELGQLGRAEEDLNRALELLREHGGEDKPEIIEATNLLGAVLEDAGRTADALALYREALRLADSINLRPARAESLRRIGSAYAMQGDFAAATERYLQAIDIATELHDDVALSQLNGDVGDIYLEQGNVEEAIAAFKEALRLDSAHSDELGMAVGYRRLGAAYHRRGDHDRARDCYEDAKRLLERLDDAGERAVLSVQWGTLFEDQGQYRAALEHYRQALAINTDQSNDVGVAICVRHAGSAHFRLGELGTAERRFDQALSLLNKQGGHDKPELIAVKAALSALRLEQGRIDEARALATEAHREAESIQHRPAIAACLRARGAADTAEQNYERAIDRLNEALEIAKALRDEVLRAELLDDLADVYERSGRLEDALKAYNDGLKRARRLDRHALSADILLGVARCQRELGRHDVARESLEEAAEAIDQHDARAQTKALLVLERAQLAEAGGREDFAIEEYERALELLSNSGESEAIGQCRKLLLSAHARRGNLPKAAVHLAEMLCEESPGALWSTIALPRLDPVIDAAAAGPMAAGRYAQAVSEAFDIVERRLFSLVPDLVVGEDRPSDAAARWFDRERRGLAPFRDDERLRAFQQFAIGALEGHRNDGSQDVDPVEAFGWIGVAHLLMKYMEADEAAPTPQPAANHVAANVADDED